MGHGSGITFSIEALDKFSAPFAAFNRKMAESTAGLRLLGSRMGSLERETGLVRLMDAGHGVLSAFGKAGEAGVAFGSKMALVGGTLGFAFKKGFVDVASQFEKYETVLNTLNRGDTAKSKKEMGWISDFAAKTPYELSEVTAAFVKLRSYGMEPMHGLLTTLGDTASGMGKGLDQAVEAIADAVTGENERLKEFGINANKVGGKIVYNYTNAAGQQAKLMVKAGDRMAIQAALMKVWQEKYGGGMEAQSKTFGGMMSNLSDAWTRIANKAMSGGAFDFMKAKLSGILDTIDKMSGDGRLDAWARQWGERITYFLGRAWELGKGFAEGLGAIGKGLAWTADLLGGWERLGLVLVALMGLKLVVAIASLAGSFWTLGVAILTTPIGWITLGVAALAVGIVYLVRNFETVVPALAKLAMGFGVLAGVIFMTPVGWFAAAIGALTLGIMTVWRKWDQICAWFKERTPKWVQKMFGADDAETTSGHGREGAAPGAMADAQKAWGNFPEGPSLGAGRQRPTLGAAALTKRIDEQRYTSLERKESKVTVDFLNVPRGASVRQQGSPVDSRVSWDMGPAMAS